jgi:hypothetical protein
MSALDTGRSDTHAELFCAISDGENEAENTHPFLQGVRVPVAPVPQSWFNKKIRKSLTKVGASSIYKISNGFYLSNPNFFLRLFSLTFPVLALMQFFMAGNAHKKNIVVLFST